MKPAVLRVFEKWLLLRGLGCFYKGVGTTPLLDSWYGYGSRTLIFEHPRLAPSAFRME